ncbi:MAG: ATP-binding protein [Pirellulaceae bacterium]|nr:ATP-binding protein [Pirellulaceae bacterium]
MIPRHLSPQIADALRDTPVVYLQGARQTGKSTLAKAIAAEHGFADYLTLDAAAALSAADSDPEGFLAGLEGPTVIDEVQRVPRLVLAIKADVDRCRRPGRFLLTGSASVMALPKLSESLAGRMELHTLWPFSQGELIGRRETFVSQLFGPTLNPPDAKALTQREIVEQLIVGGYPEARIRDKEERRHAWFDSYLTAILQRDVRDLANVDRLAELPRLLSLLASRTCQLINHADIARTLAIPQTTLKRYLSMMEMTFLVRLLPAWFMNIGKRLAKSPKLLILDTGLLTHLLAVDAERLQADHTLLGHVLENFVAVELLKQLGWSQRKCGLFHFRTTSGQEVDLVLEDASGQLVGIEVKAGATVDRHDFRGLKTLAETVGDRFARGVVLYMGPTPVPFAERLHALPIHWLWT